MPRPFIPRAPQAPALKPQAFTLIELLVVVTIIVILLALLVGGLDRALKLAEKTKCGSTQRGIANSAAQYALEFERTFPVATVGATATVGTLSMDVRNGAANNEAAQKAAAVGIGHLMVNKRLAITGDQITCPSLDTTSGLPLKHGMDEEAAGNGSGGSYWNLNRIIRSSYHYRALSYYRTHGNAHMRTNVAGNASFAITMDTVTHTPANNKYGRYFHHLDGWNVSRGDGSTVYIRDRGGPLRIDNTPAAGGTNGYVEEVVIGGEANGYKGPTGFPNTYADGNQRDVNGDAAAPGIDEAVFTFFGKGGEQDSTGTVVIP